MAWQPFQCEKGSKYGRPCVLAKYHQARKAKPLRPLYCIGRKLIKLDDSQTCTRPKIFVISYLLFLPALIWQKKIEKKNSAGCQQQKDWWKFSFSEAYKCSVVFINHFVFRRQCADFFFSQKMCQMKAGQNNKYDYNKTCTKIFQSILTLLST